MSAAAAKRMWWQDAPNPPCQSWCEVTHGPDEFKSGGMLSCIRRIFSTSWFEVEVHQATSVTEDEHSGDLETLAPVVWATQAGEFTELSLTQIDTYANALSAATAYARLFGGR